MRKLVLCVAALCLSGMTAMAADDPIAVRKHIMDSVGAAAGLSGGMMKGQIPYSPAAGKSATASMMAAASSFGAFFPEGTDTGDTTASPKIWEDAAGFQKALDKFAADAGAAMAASGKDGPADLESFKAAMGPVFQNCKSCHEAYRIKK
ncbi:cytochrome c [uncultured Roseibium sp.]|uniref:c-type cytochrome n=1 Tax=uncultured Roseibium sp. TaxID=1936171 RepID=UPI003216D8DE